MMSPWTWKLGQGALSRFLLLPPTSHLLDPNALSRGLSYARHLMEATARTSLKGKGASQDRRKNLGVHRPGGPRTPASAPAGARRNGLLLRIGARCGLPQRIQDTGRQRPRRRAPKPQ